MNTDPTPIRLGFVGLRNIGMNHVRKALELPGVSITALADTDAQRRTAALETVGGDAALHDSADALFADANVDAVVLALPNHLHAPLSIAAMRAGKDVLVEKPLALNAEAGRAMIRERDATGRCLMVGMNQRFTGANAAARKAIADGAIGEVQQAQTRWLRDRTPLWGGARGAWCLSRAQSGGGPLIDLGIHKIDQVLFLTGTPPKVEQVSGFATYGIGRRDAAAQGAAYEVEDYAFGLVRFANGFALTVEAGFFTNLPGETQETLVLGTDGAIYVSKGKASLRQRVKGELAETALDPDPETAQSCVEHFCRVLRGQEPLTATAEVGVEGLEIVEAIYRDAGVA